MASGWTTDGVVVRTNGRTSGPTIWNNDATAGQVIDSAGHDINDETLADSIEECLNLKGYNAMLANLNVGSFKIVALAPGTVDTDAVNFEQLTTLQTQVDNNTAVIGANSVDIDTLQAQVALNTPAIAQNASDIADNTAAIAAIDVSGLQPQITQNANDIAQNAADISAIETVNTNQTIAINANTGNISTNTSVNNTQNNRLDALESGNASLWTYQGLANGEYDGIACDFRYGATTAFGAPVQRVGATTNRDVQIAVTNPELSSYVVGLSTGTTNVTSGTIRATLLLGYYRNTAWNFTVGDPIYLAASDTGAPNHNLTQIKPGTGIPVIQVGIAMDTDIIFFNPSAGYPG